MFKLIKIAILSTTLLTGALSPIKALAQESSVKQLWANLAQKDFPVAAETCGLKRVSFLDYHNWIIASKQFKGGYYTTHSVGVVLETTDASCNQKYGVVQFVKGCSYHMSKNRNTGVVSKFFDEVRDLRGEETRPIFLDWAVDSTDINPLKVSVNNLEARAERGVGDYRVARTPFHLDANHPEAGMKAAYETLFTATNPNTPLSYSLRSKPNSQSTQIFLNLQSPGSTYMPKGYRDSIDATIPSYIYKTCVYQLKDIPQSGDPASFNTPAEQGGPLHCFDWNDNMRIEPSTGEMSAGETIDSFCTGSDAKTALNTVKDELAAKSIWNFPKK